jgi:microcystin-dependent protein
MPNTSRLNLPYPALTDPPNGPAAIQALAEALDAAITPAGTLQATARSSAVTGWLLCDGAAVSRTTYADLFTAIGDTYGAGNGTTTFNLPDLRGRVPVGVDGTAGRLAANDALGNTGGAQTHTLATSEIPNHDHALVTRVGATSTGDGSQVMGTSSGAGGTPSFVGSTTGEGGGGAHNNMQPYQVVNWMIKT